MFAIYATATGALVSVGSVVVAPLPEGLSVLDLGADDSLLTGYGRWDPATRSVLPVIPSPGAIEATIQSLTDVTTLQGRLTRLAAYKVDADITAVLAQTNNQALQTATLNRALKAMVRREERLTATLALLVRLIDPALLADISDTIDT